MATAASLLNPVIPERDHVDYRLAEFVLDPENRAVKFGTGSKLDIVGAVIDTGLTLTIEGASTVEITVQDTGGKLLTGDLLTGWAWGTNADDRNEAHWMLDGRAIDATLDDIDFRLTVVELLDGEQLKLTFEERLVALLRAHAGARKVYRDAGVTRAEFVYQLCKAAGLSDDEIYIPELHAPQQVASQPADKVTPAQRRAKGKKGLDRTPNITIKGAKATPAQVKNLQIALDVADGLNAPELAILAMLCAGIGESGFNSIPNAGGSNYTGVFQGSKSIFKATDTKEEAHWFLKGGKGFNAGGAIHLAKQHLSPGEIATRVESGGQSADFYGSHLSEAKRILAAYAPGGLGLSASRTIEVQKPYAFARGKKETSWDAIQRLAQEVQWRAFVRKGVFWYASEEYLFAQAPQFVVDRGKLGVEEVTGTIDLGARNLVAELSVTARAGRWTALQGMVASVRNRGPADGRWLVHQVEGPLTDDSITVTLNKPLPAKLEPANETQTLTFGASGSVGKVAAADVRKLTPKEIIDKFVLPIARRNGINVTPASVAAANARHGPTVSGGRSDHQGPPSHAWAADMSNGTHPTPQMDALAHALGALFGIPVHFGSGALSGRIWEKTEFGFKIQIIYRTMSGGNHTNHVHCGLHRV